MAKWDDIINTERFKNAPLKEQLAVRDEYFNAVILPKIKKRRDDPDTVKKAFYDFTEELNPDVYKQEWEGSYGVIDGSWEGSYGVIGGSLKERRERTRSLKDPKERFEALLKLERRPTVPSEGGSFKERRERARSLKELRELARSIKNPKERDEALRKLEPRPREIIDAPGRWYKRISSHSLQPYGDPLNWENPKDRAEIEKKQKSGENFVEVKPPKIFGKYKVTWEEEFQKAKAIKDPEMRQKAISKLEGVESHILDDPITDATMGAVMGAMTAVGKGAQFVIKEAIKGALGDLSFGATDAIGFAGKKIAHKTVMKGIIKAPSGVKNLLEIPPDKISKLDVNEIYKLGNNVTSNEVEEIAPYINRLAERLGPTDTANIIKNNLDEIEKVGENKLLRELSNAVYRKETIGKYGSVTKIVNKQKVIDGVKTMPVYEAEMNLLKKLPKLEKQQGLLEPSNRIFDKVPELKELLYKPAQAAEHAGRLEFQKITTELLNKKISQKSSKRIMIYAVSKQNGGMDILKTMKKKIPKLTEKELEAYNFMRSEYENLYKRLQEVRKLAGKDPFPKVENYFTFFKQLDNMKEMGFNPVQAHKDLISKFINPNTTPFAFAKKRIKNDSPVELDAINVFKKYLRSSLEHIHLSPSISKTNLYTGGMLKSGKKQTYKLYEDNPYLSDFLKNWSEDLSGKKRITELGGVKLKKLDDLAGRANKNLVYSVLSYNVRSALMQPLAARNTIVEIGLKNTVKGFEMNLSNKWRKYAMDKSNVLNTRFFEAGIEEATTSAKKLSHKVGNFGLEPLKILDMETAKGTWLGAFNKSIKEKRTIKEAIDYADDVIIRTQGSASKLDKTPISRTPTGRAIALFQTFATADYQFLKKDILGIKKKMPKKEVYKKFLKYMATTEAINIALEEAGIRTPFPNPIETIRKSAESGDSTSVTALKFIKELATAHPMFSSITYGKSLGGSALNTIQDAFQEATKKKEIDFADFIIDIMKVTGAPKVGAVPGLTEVERYMRIKELKRSDWEAIIGAYPDKK